MNRKRGPLARTKVAMQENSYSISNVPSEEESEISDALANVPRVNGVNGPEVITPSDIESVEGDSDDGDAWDLESLYEDTLGEMDDEQLFAGGE